MRSLTATVVITLACLIGSSSGQQRPKRKAVVVPANILLTTIANQPDCALKFDKVRTVVYVDGDGGGGEVYELRNYGSKAIRAYTVAVWTSNGTGNIVEQKQIKTGLLLPGQKTLQCDEGREVEIVPMTDDLRARFKFHGPMKAVSVFIVVRVEFADGSVYSDEPTFEALQEYFEQVDSKPPVN